MGIGGWSWCLGWCRCGCACTFPRKERAAKTATAAAAAAKQSKAAARTHGGGQGSRIRSDQRSAATVELQFVRAGQAGWGERRQPVGGGQAVHTAGVSVQEGCECKVLGVCGGS